MTDREKLIELLKQVDACICDLCGDPGSLDRVTGVIADHLIYEGVTVQRWIPASEPPEDDEEVVITWSKHFADMAFDVLSDFNQMEVTHWMPAPEPPKEEEK